jgi:hypothetical protein
LLVRGVLIVVDATAVTVARLSCTDWLNESPGVSNAGPKSTPTIKLASTNVRQKKKDTFEMLCRGGEEARGTITGLLKAARGFLLLLFHTTSRFEKWLGVLAMF